MSHVVEYDYEMAQCVSPITLKNKASVPCGRCLFCKQNDANAWSFRLWQESLGCDSAYFVTMTYDEDHVPWGSYDMTLNKDDIRKFLMRFRKIANTRYKQDLFISRPFKKFKYFLAGEYGSPRPHYHGIFFNLHKMEMDLLAKTWGKGSVKIGTCTPASIAYVTKYMLKDVKDYPGVQQPFRSMSKNLGMRYVELNKQMHRRTKSILVRNGFGKLQILPRVFRDKIFNRLELDLIWKDMEEDLLQIRRDQLAEKKLLNSVFQQLSEIEAEWMLEQGVRQQYVNLEKSLTKIETL